ncbi:hypothetical protein TcBrA4_0115910 [Trypanosoma cruzi]|nr:hypothetical protein TcBrA4_0115910 [Trypanosoma cruzi]
MVPALSPALSAGSRPLPTRSPATNRTLALNGTRLLTLPWARTAAPIHSAPPTRRPRMAPQESLSPAKTQELFNATTVLDGVGTAPTHPSTAPAESKIPSESNAAPPLGNDLFDLENVTELVSMGLKADSNVHRCESLVCYYCCCFWGCGPLRALC